MRKFLKIKPRASHQFARALAVFIICTVLISSAIFYFLQSQLKPTKAAWYNASWNYRTPITITNNGSLQSNHVIEVTLDSKTLIDTTKLQSDCDDIRFTSSDGSTLIDYFTDYCSNTTSVNSSFFVEVPSIAASTTTTIYLYYGNSGATAVSSFSSIGSVTPSGIWLGTGKDSAISVTADTNINTADTIGSRACSDTTGGDAVIYTSNDNIAAGDTTIDLTSNPSNPSCLTAGDEVLVFNAKGTSAATGDGKYEFARITSISTNVITLNRPLINAYNGTDREVVVQRVPNYTNVTLTNSGTDFVPSAWDGVTNMRGGVMAFRANGTVSLASGTTINSNALGYAGGAAGTSGANGGGGGESYMGSAGNGQSGSGAAPTGGGGESGNGTFAAPNNGIVTGGGGGGGSSGSTSSANAAGGGGGGGYGYGGGGGGGGSDGTQNSAGAGGSAGTTSTNGGGGGGGSTGTGAAGAGGNAGSAGGTGDAGLDGIGGQVGSGTTGASGGGGGNSANGAGAGGGGGGSYGSADLSILYFGSGGGGGGGSIVTPTVGTAGAAGGGIVYVQTSTLSNSGTIESDGGAGNVAGAQYRGGGGAGAGGSVLISMITDTIGTVTATGGAAASHTGTDLTGAGAGGDGRVHLKYTDSSPPTSTPTANTAQVPSVTLGSELDYTTYQASLITSAHWKFDEGYGLTAYGTVENSISLTGTSLTWKNDEYCIFSKCIYFDGTDDYVTASGEITGVKTVSFWVRPVTSSEQLIDLNGIASISTSSGTISATSFTSPTIYVNGNISSTIVANQWNHVVVTTNTGIDATAFVVGKVSTNYGQAYFDDVRLFNTALSADEVKTVYNSQGLTRGASTSTGGSSLRWLSDGLLAHLKLDESSGAPSDSTGSGYTFTNNGTTTYTIGKYANGSEHIPASSQYFSIAADSVDTYYFDASDGGPTDPNTNWANDANAFDGSTSTSADATSTGSTSLRYLLGEGTNAPGSGGTITQVRGRVYGYHNNALSATIHAAIYTDSGAELLGIPSVTRTDTDGPGWGNYSTLSAPSGGWGWTTLQSLEVRNYVATHANQDALYRTEIEVTSTGTSSISNVSTISFWANPDSTTNYYINLTSSANITSSGGTLTTSGITNPKIYINGVESTTIVADQWQHIVVTTDTPITADQFYVGRVGSNYYDGTLDEIRIYNRQLPPNEIRQLSEWAPGAVGHWNFDENTGTTANDISTQGNTGSITGATWQPGIYGSALRFDGLNDVINAGSNTIIDDIPVKTITMWINLRAQDSTSNRLLEKAFTGWFYAAIPANSQTILYEQQYSTANGQWSTPTDSVPLNQWTHVAITHNRTGTNAPIIYINGISQTLTELSTPSGTAQSETSGNLYIGNVSDATRSFDGAIDDVKIYNYARTPNQIIQDMNAGHPLVGTPIAGPAGHWKFDEGALNTCTGGTNDYCDSTPNANDLAFSTTTGGHTNEGRTGKAFNGTGAIWASRADDADFDFGASESFSIATWFRSDATNNPGGNEFILNKSLSGGTQEAGYAIYINNSGQICAAIDDDSTWTTIPTDLDVNICTSTDYYDTAWHHVIVVRNTSTDKLELYIDGKLATSTTDTTTGTLANGRILYVGDRQGVDAGDELNGDLDELKIYRAAMTISDVQVELNQGKSLVLGALSTNSTNTESTNATSREYCIPGDTTTCNAPVGEWKFDENTSTTANDTSTNGYTATLSNGPSWRTGKIGGALSFDGSDDYVATTNTSVFSASSAFTVEAWINPRSMGEGSPAAGNIVSKSGIVDIFGEAASLSVCYASDSCTNFAATPDNALTLNKWQHIAAVHSGSGNFTLYIDGRDRTSDSTTVTPNNSTGAITIGAEQTGTTDYTFDGLIDNVRIFDYARSGAQVAWSFNRGAPLGWWKLDETSGSTAYDSSQNGNGETNGNTGSLSGSPTRTTSGKFNSAIDFDGSDDHINITDADMLDITGNFTLSAWISKDGGGSTQVISKTNGGTSGGYALLTGGSGEVYCRTNNGSSTTDSRTDFSALTTGWHHVAAVRNGTSCKVYIDAVDRTGTTGTHTTVTANALALRIGSMPNDTERFNGLIDDVRIYNYALTQKQLEVLFNENSATTF